MTLPAILNGFDFPPEAMEHFQKQGMSEKRINGTSTGSVSEFQLNGHDKGIGYIFKIILEKNELLSEEADMLMENEVQIIQWIKSKREKPVERVHMLPEQLLKFKKVRISKTMPNGVVETQMVTKFPLECVGGSYKDSYLRWRNGLGTQGLELSRWQKASLSHVSTLRSEGIFTVEQFAEADEDRVKEWHSRELQALYKEAKHFVNAQAPIEGIREHAEEVLAVKQENADLKRRLEALEASLADKPKRGRPFNKKAETEE